MKWIGFEIEIAWLMVRMAKRSSVATRRNIHSVNGPWVETHGYLHMSLRDIRVVISRKDVMRTPPLCGKWRPLLQVRLGLGNSENFVRFVASCENLFLTTDATDGPCIRMIRAIRGSMFVLRALCVLIAKFWKK
jgi:hypothetical protein